MVLFPAMAFVGDLIDSALGGDPPAIQTETLTNPVSFLGFLLLMILGGPLAEELGWRGFARDPLQKGRSALSASLILGVIWALWHLPLFFIEGTSQAAIGLGSTVFWLWHVQVVALSVGLTQALPSVKNVVDALKEAGLRDNVKIIVGGNAANEERAAEAGVDAYGTSAIAGLRIIEEWTS